MPTGSTQPTSFASLTYRVSRLRARNIACTKANGDVYVTILMDPVTGEAFLTMHDAEVKKLEGAEREELNDNPNAPASSQWTSQANWERSSRSDHVGRRGCRPGVSTCCSTQTPFRWLHADHIIPHSKGGPTSLANGQMINGAENLAKGDTWSSEE